MSIKFDIYPRGSSTFTFADSRYQRAHTTMISRSKCRPLNSSCRLCIFFVTLLPSLQKPDSLPELKLCTRAVPCFFFEPSGAVAQLIDSEQRADPVVARPDNEHED